MEQNEQDYVNKLINESNQKTAQIIETTKAANSVMQGNQDANLIELQIEMDSILEKLDHSLRGHVLKHDEKGNLTWQEPDDSKSKILSESGVQAVIRILSIYLSRNTILSNFDEKKIDKRVYDLGIELNDLFFTNYEDFFYSSGNDHFAFELGYEDYEEALKENDEDDLNDIEMMIHDERSNKFKFYNIMVLKIVDSVEAAYLRAKGAGERQSLRKSYMVTQNDSPNQMNFPQPKKSFNAFHPIRSLR